MNFDALTHNKKIIAILLLASVTLGYAGASVKFHIQEQALIKSFYPLRTEEKGFEFAHPLLAYETPEATVLPAYADLQNRIEELVARKKGNEGTDSISVYYRNLVNSRWIGVNEDLAYYPASLLKVPLMIAYLKAADTNPVLFSREVTYESLPQEKFETPSTLVVGRNYSVQKLVEKMIIDSDNGAMFTLLSRIDPDLLANVYKRLGIIDPTSDESPTHQIPTRTYALFFRTLYNATYLTPNASEQALTLLSHANFQDGLVAGIPAGIPIAHKFGEHIVTDAQGNPTGVELHDCGIIYKPESPYLLCIMTRTKTLDTAKDVISDVSKLVYDFGE